MRKSPAVAGLFRQAEAAAKQRPKSVKNPGVVKGRLPLKLYSGSDGMHVRTDENLQVFIPCGFCRPGANARGKTRKNSKKRRSAAFSTLSRPLQSSGPRITSYTALAYFTSPRNCATAYHSGMSPVCGGSGAGCTGCTGCTGVGL